MEDKCIRVQELMPWLLSGLLESSETIRTLDHIRDCDACKRELAFVATVSQAAKSASNKAPTPAFLSRLWARLDEQIRSEQKTGSESGNAVVKQGMFRTSQGLVRATVRTVGYVLMPFGFTQAVVRLAYQSILREFGQIIDAIAP